MSSQDEVCAYCGKEVFHNGFNYQHVDSGLYCKDREGKLRLVEAMRDDPNDTCKCGALRKDHSHAENHSFVLDEFPSHSGN